MKRYFYLFKFLLLTFSGIKAQNVINTDRPDQSDGTHIVEKNYFQVETGAQFSKLDKLTKGFDNVTLIRYGVSRKFEVRLLNQYSVLHDSGISSGVRPIAISFKNQLCAQHGPLPKITLVSYFRLPITISPSFSGNHFGYTFTLAARHDLSSKMKIYSNFGITRDQMTTEISWLTTLELNYNFTENFCAYAEYFGNYAAHEDAANGLDIGFIFAFRKNLAVDLAFGSPTMNPGTNRFISFGLSIHLPK